jgi:pimeloyl-ACP methyl ester carboxylesterase
MPPQWAHPNRNVRPRLPVDHLKGRYHRDVNESRSKISASPTSRTKPEARRRTGSALIDPSSVWRALRWAAGARSALYGGDRYLSPLRDWLRRIGYSPVPSGLEQNPGWSEPLVNDLGELAETHFRRTGQRVTIIGHSMGGLQGRAVAARRPRVVRHVIALGSP